MSIGRVLYGNALGRLGNVQLIWGGVGWDGYDCGKAVQENLGDLDAVWVYKGEGLKGLEEVPVRVVTFNEANDEKTIAEIDQAKANLVVFHHENDIGRWQLDCRVAHILHGAEYGSTQPDKSGCLVAGVVSKEIYPLRARMFELVRSGRLDGRIRKHPGYRLRSHKDCQRQYKCYIDDLNAAKILLTCTSVYKYSLAKIVEAMALGTVVISDMPEDSRFRDSLGRAIVEVPSEASEECIVGTVNGLLKNHERWLRLSDASREIASKFTTRTYAEHLLGEIKSCYATTVGRSAG